MTKKTLVVYYSKTGNNKYLAEKIAQKLKADINAIKPTTNYFFVLIISTLMKLKSGIKKLSFDINEYSQVIICGPIWMGQLISPLRRFIKTYKKSINSLYFATCCGSSETEKNSNYGYSKVFLEVKKLAGNKLKYCEAFPIDLVLSEEEKMNNDILMKTRLSNDNFTGEIEKRFKKFIEIITQ